MAVKTPLFCLIAVFLCMSVYAFNTETKKIREVKKGKYIIDIDYPYITDKTPAAKAINDAIHKKIASRQSEFASGAEEISFLDTVEPFSLKTVGEPVICLNNGSIFSCYMLFADYEGAAYPWHSYEAFNFIINNGKVRSFGLRDVFGENLNPAAERFVPEFKGDGNMLEECGDFAVSGFGMELLFGDFVFDTGGNSFIKKSIERKDLEDLIREPALKEFYSNPKAHINIDSEVIFPGGET
ncbi:MAG: hypothetical protein KBT47_04445, partial [Armatimonadetes bacterium]|nr:hypothetical protein [Candidatus Hippobium faecium]